MPCAIDTSIQAWIIDVAKIFLRLVPLHGKHGLVGHFKPERKGVGRHGVNRIRQHGLFLARTVRENHRDKQQHYGITSYE